MGTLGKARYCVKWLPRPCQSVCEWEHSMNKWSAVSSKLPLIPAFQSMIFAHLPKVGKIGISKFIPKKFRCACKTPREIVCHTQLPLKSYWNCTDTSEIWKKWEHQRNWPSPSPLTKNLGSGDQRAQKSAEKSKNGKKGVKVVKMYHRLLQLKK